MAEGRVSRAWAALAFDHVLLAVRDFGETVARLRAAHGLAALEGGRHTGWGTANWIVPLGDSYIELVSVVDPGAAATNDFGRRAQRAIAEGGGLFAWCVTTRDFDATVSRLGLDVAPGSRRRPDGAIVSWRAAGLAPALADPSRPFFLAWEIPAELHPGRASADHEVRPHGIAWVEVAGDEKSVRDWLGDDKLPVRVRPGAPALRAVGIATDEGEVVLR